MAKHRTEPYAESGAALQQNGFVVVRNCIGADALSALVDEYESKIIPQKHECDVRRESNGPAGEDGRARVVHVSNMYELPGLAHLAADPRLLQLASACLGNVGVRPVINTELFDKPPDGDSSTRTAPHQDNFYFRAEEPGISLWIALDDMDTDSGTVQYVQGSHLKGLRYHDWDDSPGGFLKIIYDFTDEDDDNLQEVGHLSPGDVVVHHGLTIHYAPGNVTNRRRRGLVVNYVAEHVANSLADDLYQPALTIECAEAGHFVAPLPQGWPERHALAATSVMCALAGWRGVEGGIQSNVRIEGGNRLIIEIADSSLRRQAVAALVSSGHVVRGAKAVQAMPLQYGSFISPAPGQRHRSSSSSKTLDRYVGVWTLCEEADSGAHCLGVRLQTSFGLYVDFRIPKSILKIKSFDADCTTESFVLIEHSSSAGSFSVQESGQEDQDIVLRHPSIDFNTFDGMADVGCMSWQAEAANFALETSVPGALRNYHERWVRVDEPIGGHNMAALELFDGGDGRPGYWIVIGSWFARLLGRPAGDILNDVVCRSLPHFLNTYAEAWEIRPEKALSAYEASLGRVDAPGVFRIVSDSNSERVGSFLLDGSGRHLRRDATDDDILVETFSNRRWKVVEMQNSFAAFGRLKRIIDGGS